MILTKIRNINDIFWPENRPHLEFNLGVQINQIYLKQDRAIFLI